MGNTHSENSKIINEIVDRLEKKYPGKKKGVFLANDTYANIMLNILVRKYGTLPEDFRIVGFDNSPVSAEAVIPISTVDQRIDKMVAEAMKLLVMQMDERKKRQPEPLKEPIHKIVTPILVPRDTTK